MECGHAGRAGTKSGETRQEGPKSGQERLKRDFFQAEELYTKQRFSVQLFVVSEEHLRSGPRTMQSAQEHCQEL